MSREYVTYEAPARSIDSETTGLDRYHGAKPFFVTTCKEDMSQLYWEWDVNPYTREPIIPKGQLNQVRSCIGRSGAKILHNAKFDIPMLGTVGINWQWWDDIEDTLLASHLEASSLPHDLTSLAINHLGIDIQPYEKALEEEVQRARRHARTNYPDWLIAREGLECMPSAKKQVWKFDTWLCRAIAKEENLRKSHIWWTVLRDYANADSAITMLLWKEYMLRFKERGLENIYRERLKLIRGVIEMEDRGVTVNRLRKKRLTEEYQAAADKANDTCVRIGGEGLKKLPVNGTSNALKETVFGTLGLKSNKKSKKTGEPSMDKGVLEYWLDTLPQESDAHKFVQALSDYRSRKTAITYMTGYEGFWLPTGKPGWYVLHPSLNPTGTNTLRWSCQNPNSQNISKKAGFNLRYCFGPAPGREWWSLDAKNIELRIPAYEANEKEMIRLFEHPDEPPYFGSYHLLVFDTLHPEKFAEHGVACKDIYESTWYQWVKNGNFAVQYGAIEKSGTADRAYHVKGAQRRVMERFRGISGLNQKMIRQAEAHGYVETMIDKNVDPKRGYPLQCTRDQYGRIKPTVPLNYHTQGTAMWWMMKAMIRCGEYLRDQPDHHIVMQVHDELVFDFPAPTKKWTRKPWEYNLPKIKRIKELMEKGGDDIGIPTAVSVKYHDTSWNEAQSVEV